jgi:hypothetical protein
MGTATRQLATLQFSSDESNAAHDAWGCNCGPAALAFALGMTLDEIRPHLGDFEARRYTNPTLMLASIKRAGGRVLNYRTYEQYSLRAYTIPRMTGLLRIQWNGPWTERSANPRWAYRHTHWIAPWLDEHEQAVFDVNCGIVSFEEWARKIVPQILKTIPRASGTPAWWATHQIELEAST